MNFKQLLSACGLLMCAALVACGPSAQAGTRAGGAFAGGTMSLQSSTPSPTAAQAAHAGQGSGGSHSTTSSSTKPAPVATGSPIPQYAPGTLPAPATATLSATCVTRGGLETLTIKTVPGYSVTFDAQYSDGRDGQKYGGMGYGYASSDGTFGGTWAVAPTAPLGPVTVWVAVAHGQYSAFRQPRFSVATSC